MERELIDHAEELAASLDLPDESPQVAAYVKMLGRPCPECWIRVGMRRGVTPCGGGTDHADNYRCPGCGTEYLIGSQAPYRR